MQNFNLNKIIADNLEKDKFQSKSNSRLPVNGWLNQYKSGGTTPKYKTGGGGPCPDGFEYSEEDDDCIPIGQSNNNQGFYNQGYNQIQNRRFNSSIGFSNPGYDFNYDFSLNPITKKNMSHSASLFFPNLFKVGHNSANFSLSGNYSPEREWRSNFNAGFPISRNPNKKDKITLTGGLGKNFMYNDPKSSPNYNAGVEYVGKMFGEKGPNVRINAEYSKFKMGGGMFPEYHSWAPPRMANGGGLLSRTVTCSRCGHSWKGVTGGMDPITCHDCGGMIKMEQGGQPCAEGEMWSEELQKCVKVAATVKHGNETKYYHEPGSGGLNYQSVRTVSPYLSNRDIKKYTPVPTSGQDVDFISNYRNFKSYFNHGNVGDNFNPTSVPYEGEKHWNINRFIIDPHLGNAFGDLKASDSSSEEKRASILSDMYKYYMLQNPGHQGKAFRQAKRFVRKEVDPIMKGAFLNDLYAHNLEHTVPNFNLMDALNTFDEQNPLISVNTFNRGMDQNESMRRLDGGKYHKEDWTPDKLKNISIDYLTNYKKMSKKDARKQWKTWEEDAVADQGNYNYEMSHPKPTRNKTIPKEWANLPEDALFYKVQDLPYDDEVGWNIEYSDPTTKKTNTKHFNTNEQAEQFYNDPANKSSKKYSDLIGHKYGGDISIPDLDAGNWLSKYDEGGPGDEKITLTEAAEKGKHFNEQWMNSPMYKKMLAQSTGQPISIFLPNINEIDKQRKNELANTTWGIVNQEKEKNGELDTSAAWSQSYTPWHLGMAGNPTTIEKYENYPTRYYKPYVGFVKQVAGKAGDELSSDAAHEFSHSSDKGGILIPDKDLALMKKYASSNYLKSPLFQQDKSRYSDFSNLSSNKDYIKAQEDWLKYVNNPTETRARLNDFRMRAKEQGLYDPFTQPFNIKYLNKYKQIDNSIWDPINQLRGSYSDEEISDMLNKISKSDNGQPQSTAKYGGWLKEYGPGGVTTQTTTPPFVLPRFDMPRQGNDSNSGLARKQEINTKFVNQKVNEANETVANFKRANPWAANLSNSDILTKVQMAKSTFQNQGTIKKAGPERSTASKVWAIASHPMTALKYKVHGQDIPDNFEKGEKNILDEAVNIINPATYINSGYNLGKAALNPWQTTKTLTKAGINLATNLSDNTNVFNDNSNSKALGLIGDVGNMFMVGETGAFKPLKGIYNDVATGESALPFAWKSPAVGLSQEASADMFKGLMNSDKLTDAERALVVEYQHNSRPFTGRSNYGTSVLDQEKKTAFNNLINKYKLNINNNSILTRRFNPDNGSLGATLENGRLNFGDRPTSFSAGVGIEGYGSGANNRIVIPNRYAKEMGNNLLVNPYGKVSDETLKLIDENAKNYAVIAPSLNEGLTTEREVFGTGLDFKRIGKVKNDIGGYDWIVKPNSNTKYGPGELAGAGYNAAKKAVAESMESGLLSKAHTLNPFAGTFQGESKLPSFLQLNKLDDPNAYWRLTKDPKNYGLGEGAYFNKGVPLTKELAETFPKGSRAWRHRYSGLKWNPKTGKIDLYDGPDYLFKVSDEKFMEPHLNFPEPHLKFFRQSGDIPEGQSQLFKKDWLQGWRGHYKKGGSIGWLNKYDEGGQPEVTTETTSPMGAAGPILSTKLIGALSDVAQGVKNWIHGPDKQQPVIISEPEETLHIKLTDPRRIRMTTGKAMNARRDLMGGDYVLNDIRDVIEQAKKSGLSKQDAYNLAAIDFQETQLGNIDNEMGHAKDGIGNTPQEKFLNAYISKMKEADRLKIKDPYLRLQVYNGMGKIYPTTEQWYHGYKANSFYGVPVPKTGIDLRKNPLYGKQIVDLRDNVLKKNLEFNKFIDNIYSSKKFGGEISWLNKYK